MWPRCTECNRLIGKHRYRCVVCGSLLCQWCGWTGFCAVHYNEMDNEGRNKTTVMRAVFIIIAVLSVVFFVIGMNILSNSAYIGAEWPVGLFVGLFFSLILWLIIYRGILRNIYNKHT